MLTGMQEDEGWIYGPALEIALAARAIQKGDLIRAAKGPKPYKIEEDVVKRLDWDDTEYHCPVLGVKQGWYTRKGIHAWKPRR